MSAPASPSFFHRMFADNTNPSSVASRLRRRRFEVFRCLVRQLPPPVTVLDVGGTVRFWKMLPDEALRGLTVTLLNRVPLSDPLPGGFGSVLGDARDLSQFEDHAFDVVFSNSVIEHVGGPQDQIQMAQEVRRVGRLYYVQTPNRRFPIEPHFQFPLFQYLPESAQVALLRRLSLGWYDRISHSDEAKAVARSIRLLSKREFRALFPDGIVFTEWFMGLPKSFVAIRRLHAEHPRRA